MGGLPQKRCRLLPSAPQIHQDIRTCKQEIESVPFLLQSSVDYFLVAELTLQNEKRMLHFATNRGFVMLNLLYPVNAGVSIGTLD